VTVQAPAVAPPTTRRLTHMEAIVEAIAREMRRDESVFFIGQDVGPFGGSLQGSKGLYEEFGPRRIREAPISESAMVGAAIGAALFGRRPIVEVSFGEFLPAAMNQLINQAPNLHYMTGGVARVPVVIRTRVGDGPYGGHPQDYSAWFAHVPGLKLVMPATPADAKGLMTAAIRDDNPVLFFEGMSLSHGPREEVPPRSGRWCRSRSRPPRRWPAKGSKPRSSTSVRWRPGTPRRSSARSARPIGS
jgi:acetoin:2,6-dichlorophenolindophenol oxidoreductase subunit beta